MLRGHGTAPRALDYTFDAYAADVALRNADANVAVNDSLFLLSKGRYEVGKIGENDLLQSELALLRAHAIDVLVTKASGGAATYAKIAAARMLGIPVIMIRRPPPPPGPLATTLEEALEWLERS